MSAEEPENRSVTVKWLKRLLPLKFHPFPIFVAAVRGSSQGKVLSGPFTGLKWVDGNVGSYFLPRLLGTYEKELHPYVRNLQKISVDRICVVGAGEGYYVAGLRQFFPQTPIVAFESEEKGRTIIEKVLAANSMGDRVSVRGHCSTQDLRKELPENCSSLLLVDIEGAEQQLLDPSLIPALVDATLLVEVHEAFSPGVESVLRGRFSSSHRLIKIEPTKRLRSDFPILWGRLLALIEPRYLEWAMSEGRPGGIFWFLMEPH